MRVFLIRHGETEHNVAGLLAGSTDSRLTNHGLNQAQRLGVYLTTNQGLQFSQIFASNLQRAVRTAKEICACQNVKYTDVTIAPIELALLQEQDFGSFELLPWNRTQDVREQDPKEGDAGFKPKETHADMNVRATLFLDDYLLPLFALEDEEVGQNIAIVSHGLFLAAIWRTLLLRFRSSTVTLLPDAVPPGTRRPLEHLPTWTNTGFLELVIKLDPEKDIEDDSHTEPPQTSDPLSRATMQIHAVNKKEHLANLKRMRGGIGSSASDDKQRKLEGFFKRPKMN